MIICLQGMRTCFVAIAGLFSVPLISHYSKDTGSLKGFHEKRVRVTTPYEDRGNMRKLHKEHVLNPTEHTCQCKNMRGFTARSLVL